METGFSTDGKTFFDLTNGIIKISDGEYDRCELGKINSNYGGTFRDAKGVVTIDLGSLQSVYKKIYETVIDEDCTFKEVSDLDGDADLEYLIRTRFVRAGAEVTDIPYGLQLNGDAGENYGMQFLRVSGSGMMGAGGGGQTAMRIGKADNVGEISQGEFILHAKSGYIRTLIGSYSENVPRVGGNIEFDH
ncbi:unnamed protein product, partial [marine sediment metagenome]